MEIGGDKQLVLAIEDGNGFDEGGVLAVSESDQSFQMFATIL